MKTVVETPEQKLKGKIERYKKEYSDKVKWAKERYRYDVSPIPAKAKIIDKLIRTGEKENVRRGELYFHSERFDERKLIAKEMMGNALSVKVDVTEGSYLNLANLRLSEDHYNISFWILKGLRLRHPMDYKNKPGGEEVLRVAQSYFPNVKLIQ